METNLIEQIGATKIPDRDLDAAIAVASKQFRKAANTTVGWFVYGDSSEGVRAPRYTEDFNAALSVKPEGWNFTLHGEADGTWTASCGYRGHVHLFESPNMPSPALATIWACLAAAEQAERMAA